MAAASRLSLSASSSSSAIALLIVTGCVFGAMFPLGRLAGQAGVFPLAWTLSMLVGGGLVLLAMTLVRGQSVPLSRPHLAYYAGAGLLSMGLPNFILFMVMPHLGVGLSSVVYTLPPILTLAFAVLLGMEKPGLRRSIGIALGFAGAAMIVSQRSNLPAPDLYGWMLLALTIPASVAAGNIFRTRFWPAGSSPLPLSAGTMLMGSAWVLLIIIVKGRTEEILSLTATPLLALIQAALNALQFLMFMRLQKAAGPVYVSQVGYVATAFGLASGALVFGETYSPWIWIASITIVLGVLVVNSARRA
ncbi:DMT family transporter [Microvirga flavescens]|uniref:DMT family transporter n=1 Tax=Microvirga flavescens TaxID=2249811 RepID=UPI000DD92726|nr:DMT family transporter [Microvirga flavescens]